MAATDTAFRTKTRAEQNALATLDQQQREEHLHHLGRYGRWLSEPSEVPHRNDVLCGRGNYTKNHPGNEHFRALVQMHKVSYVAAPKNEKPLFARYIVDLVRSLDPPGRFMKQDDRSKLWGDIGDKKALAKTRQALREGAPELSTAIEGSRGGKTGSGDEGDEGGGGGKVGAASGDSS